MTDEFARKLVAFGEASRQLEEADTARATNLVRYVDAKEAFHSAYADFTPDEQSIVDALVSTDA